MMTVAGVRRAMMNWNRFVTACVLVTAVLAKAGVPLIAILLGVASATLLNWQLRPRVPVFSRARGERPGGARV